MNIKIKSQSEIELMRLAGKDTAAVLDYITPYVQAGITTNELDRLCHNFMVEELDVIPAPLNYQPHGHKPYPKSICTSVNHQVCHGIPDDRKLIDGDIVNIDITVIKDEYHGDSSRMFKIGKVSPKANKVCEVTRECLWEGIKTVKAGVDLADIGKAIELHANNFGFSVVRDFCGHGIGRSFHEDPQVLHYHQKNVKVLILKPGMVFTIEPMINIGDYKIRSKPDGWTIVTRDRSLSAQWEHTILVTEEGYEVLTLSDKFFEPYM